VTTGELVDKKIVERITEIGDGCLVVSGGVSVANKSMLFRFKTIGIIGEEEEKELLVSTETTVVGFIVVVVVLFSYNTIISEAEADGEGESEGEGEGEEATMGVVFDDGF
jgi:hypothetical protein